MANSADGFKILSDNRQASFNYHLLEKYEAGIALSGTEVKAAKTGKVQLKDAYADIVGPLPADVTMARAANAPLDMVHVFAIEAKGLAARLRDYRAAIAPDGMIWVSWPKKSSGVASDLTDVVVRDTALPLGLVDIKVCAIDDVWSGLKFVIPKKQRTKAPKESRDVFTPRPPRLGVGVVHGVMACSSGRS